MYTKYFDFKFSFKGGARSSDVSKRVFQKFMNFFQRVPIVLLCSLEQNNLILLKIFSPFETNARARAGTRVFSSSRRIRKYTIIIKNILYTFKTIYKKFVYTFLLFYFLPRIPCESRCLPRGGFPCSAASKMPTKSQNIQNKYYI